MHLHIRWAKKTDCHSNVRETFRAEKRTAQLSVHLALLAGSGNNARCNGSAVVERTARRRHSVDLFVAGQA